MTTNDSAPAATKVVVGIDDSDGARQALAWALAEARLRGATLHLIHAWSYTPPGGGYRNLAGMPYTMMADVDLDDLRKSAELLLEETTKDATADASDVRIERDVIQGSPSDALVGAVTEDDLLVVGSRGHGGFVGLLVGSVSQQCVHHAPCPVVVVPAPKKDEGEEKEADAA